MAVGALRGRREGSCDVRPKQGEIRGNAYTNKHRETERHEGGMLVLGS